MSEEDKVEQPIIVKKIKKGGGHHGGAWKVAYADFVTAMMAFFLLLWLLNVTTDDQKNAISNYFDPTHPKVSEASSGAGGVLGGLSMAPEGAMASNVQPISAPPVTGSALNAAKATTKINDSSGRSRLDEAKDALRQEEQDRMEDAKKALEEAIANDKELQDLKDQFIVDMTPEGLRIQIIDKEGKPMFASGSARMFDRTQMLLETITGIIKDQPNEISIRGHTDSVPYAPGAIYTNWELSADRANSSRRVMLESGFPPERINNVIGKADTEHLLPDDPTNASNRRISITLLKQELTDPDFEQKAAERAGLDKQEPLPDLKVEEQPEPEPEPMMPPIGTFQKTPGAVEFP